MNEKRLNWDFSYHAPDEAYKAQHEDVRDTCLWLAKRINHLAPDSREKSLAITNLEQVMFWTQAAIARDGRPEDAC